MDKLSKMTSFILLAAVIHFEHSCAVAKDCYMDDMPDKATSVGEVSFLEVEEDSIDLTITCKCSVNSPKWDLYNLATKETQTYYSPVQCVNNGGSCTPADTSYIHQSNMSEGLYVYINRTFHLNSSAILMCYSRTEREVLVVNIEKKDATPPPPASPSPIVVTSTVLVTVTAITTVLKTVGEPIPTNTLLRPTETQAIDKEIPVVDAIVSEVGTPTLALVPVVIILAVVLVILVGCMIAMRVRHRERSKDMKNQIELLNKTNGTLEGSLQRLLPVYDNVGNREKSRTNGNHYIRTPINTDVGGAVSSV